ncbi:TolC family outer membrane protein [Mesorhizobium sp. RP14(2022)]|uniref:TolC family outer membrane protein n=1 Tax=Mesorhizobium liriopis TaxID=2953882 RepID=A0ABT1CB60_9HYPH|nr:TolC family outer membrane protein [Mesorhizobium liriopis]MCO6052045.1 TolC family outer membrane protein [Mesorhizobium liriopis]
MAPGIASAETILGALAKAYQFNSTLNSTRAGVRVTDEDVAIAKSGYRPTIAGTGSANYVSQEGLRLSTYSFGVQINQTLFDGLQTRNNVRAAESRVYASNESLRNTELNILFNAASAYMDVIRDRQIAALTERNLAFLSEQVRAAQSRFDVGEGTRTDVAQAQASRASAVASVSSARAQVAASSATYRQIVGEEPRNLTAASPQSKLLPRSLNVAYAQASEQHPAILATKYLVDAAGYTVKSTEGALLPQISATAGLSQQYSQTRGLPGVGTGLGASSASGDLEGESSASIGASITVPIYQGGRVAAGVRQAKESLGQARIEVDVQRDQVRNAVASSWSQYVSAVESVSANRQLVSAAQLALNGVIEERNVGQRTTLDVLNAQADVINAQITLAGVERDTVVASYAVLSAIGALSAERLGLKVEPYNPQEHYRAVKDKWFGLRTPDGR